MEQSIKATSECKEIDKEIKYDSTSRNANAIVQVIHDGSDATLETTKKDSCVHSKDKCDECICRELEEFYTNMEI